MVSSHSGTQTLPFFLAELHPLIVFHSYKEEEKKAFYNQVWKISETWYTE